ncbi:MAG: hypothetical protein IK083_07745 [Abditibacteriota bacterium]|nr:hypothetical protein [Abditibacteriota bacterium]
MSDTDNKEVLQDETPAGIEMLKKKWLEYEAYKESEEAARTKDIVFKDSALSVGDYSLEKEEVLVRLNVNEDALRRLTMIGELDSIVVENPAGEQRRLYSSASVDRFIRDGEISGGVTEERILEAADKELLHQIYLLQDMVLTQSKYIKYLKDMLLLEMRNIKEQNLDLTSYVYELSEKIDKNGK